MNIYFSISLLKRTLRLPWLKIERNIASLNLWNDEFSTEIKHKIEQYWSDKLCFPNYDEQDKEREKYYVLSMFPYPSGNLHMGHVRVYTISDSIARFQRMNNKNVIHPIGWDSFGLPAENAAIERNIAPDKWTESNIKHMKQQLQQLGCSFEWHRELATCDPNYYKWTQELFLKLFDAGLVYQKEALVNWDPIDKTVLADEQVDENGCSWRSGAKVEKKSLKQWFIKTTRFAKDLYDGLNDSTLHDWKDIIKIQKHWIGECNGIAVDFELSNNSKKSLTLWTSAPEYLEAAKFIAVFNDGLLCKLQGELMENGTKRLNIEAKNPINGESLPIFITDQIEYLPFATSHIGIPSISEQDSNFATKHNIDFTPVDKLAEHDVEKKRHEICQKIRSLNVGGYWTSPKLKDWLISRQRYWGTPIPMIHCEKCGAQPVPRTELPVELPKRNSTSMKGGSSLGECSEWLHTVCPKCGGSAKRETDTMDTFVDSSWYYLRYMNPKNSTEMFDVKQAKTMTPVDLYIGGKEHATLHLYYARFVSHFLHSCGLLPEREPFKRLLVQGMVMGRSFRIKGSGQYVPPSEVTILDSKRNKAVHKETGQSVVMAWEKMSKSKHNGVDPTEMFKEYSVDTTRLLILADVAPTSHRNWNSNTFPGILNWQKRLWLTIRDFLKHRTDIPAEIDRDEFKKQDEYMFDSRNFYVKGATFNYCNSQQLSVAISKMQGLTNSIRRAPPAVFSKSLQFERALACQIILVAPMAPHFASELWSGFVAAPNRISTSDEIKWGKSVLEQTWPEVDYNYNLDLVCQVNGVETAIVKIPRHEIEKMTQEQALDIALKQTEIQNMVDNKTLLGAKFVMCPSYEGVINIHVKAAARTVVHN